MWNVAITLLILISPLTTFAETTNIGFVEGLWYATDPVIAEKETRVYVVFRNNSPHDLSGTIRFSDNGKRIGSSEVHALAGRLVEAWVDWTPTHGTHSITAEMSNAKFHILGGDTEDVAIRGIVAENIIFVDIDTDGDGIVDTEDTDDDNDDISDIDEEKRGTDPKKPNPKPVDTTSAQTESETTPTVQTPVKENTPSETRGLEQYLGEGSVQSTLSGITERIDTAKQKIDTYRASRTDTEETEPAPLSSSLDASSTGITRTKVETNTSFLQKFVDGVATLFGSVWTLVLWLVSSALGHPALIQFGILVLILYFFYRTARRFGRRPPR
jgi:hypothetical protein